MPAEWEPHAATWLTWPHCEDTWPGRLDEVVSPYVEMIQALSGSERVNVNTLNEAHQERIRETLAAEGIPSGGNHAVQLITLLTDDEWVRDYGALFAWENERLVATDWDFNAWGQKYDRIEANNRVPQRMAEFLGVPRTSFPMILEGGAIEVNGEGTCVTTESCLLNPNRNPGMNRVEVAHHLRVGLGIEEIIWLGEGIAGDDTDGHIDDLARFVAPDTVVAAVEADPLDFNYEALEENLKRLRAYRTRDGSSLNIIEIPMPTPIYYHEQRLPASYLNFYIANTIILLPVFDDPNDVVARDILRACFPDRAVISIDARVLVWGFGSCHCLTQQVPGVPT